MNGKNQFVAIFQGGLVNVLILNRLLMEMELIICYFSKLNWFECSVWIDHYKSYFCLLAALNWSLLASYSSNYFSPSLSFYTIANNKKINRIQSSIQSTIQSRRHVQRFNSSKMEDTGWGLTYCLFINLQGRFVAWS